MRIIDEGWLLSGYVEFYRRGLYIHKQKSLAIARLFRQTERYSQGVSL